jgi:hypothetical protein
MGLLFITQVIDEHEEPWWNNINSEKLLICPPEFSGKPTSTVIYSKAEESGLENDELGLTKYLCSYFEGL